jgi:hypothetical protein
MILGPHQKLAVAPVTAAPARIAKLFELRNPISPRM